MASSVLKDALMLSSASEMIVVASGSRWHHIPVWLQEPQGEKGDVGLPGNAGAQGRPGPVGPKGFICRREPGPRGPNVSGVV